MQLTVEVFFGLIGTLASIICGVWAILNRFTKLEGRVDRLEEKVDEILFYLTPKKYRRKKLKHYHRKH